MAKLKGGTLLEAKDILVDLYRRQNPRGGRAAAEREVMAQLGPKGRRRVAEAERQVAAKRTRKAAAESAKRAESLKARVDRAIAEALAQPGVREALTAAKAAGQAAAAGDGVFSALATQASSPFWRQPSEPAAGASKVTGKAAATGPTAAEVAAMSTDEFRAHA